MKKNSHSKLTLYRESLLQLNAEALQAVVGGATCMDCKLSCHECQHAG